MIRQLKRSILLLTLTLILALAPGGTLVPKTTEALATPIDMPPATAVSTIGCVLDTFESDNLPADGHTVTLPVVETHSYCRNNETGGGDVDWLTAQLILGNTYVFETSNLGFGVDTFLTLFLGGTATVVALEDSPTPGGGASRITYVPDTSGPYDLRSKHETNSAGSSSTFTLTIAQTATCADAGFEPDNTNLTARSVSAISTVETRSFCTKNDHDWYTANLTTGNTYTFETSDLAAGVDTRLNLFQGTSATVLGQSDDRAAGDKSSLITYTPNASGPVTLDVVDKFNNIKGSLHTFTLSITQTAVCADAATEPDNTNVTARQAAVSMHETRAFCILNDKDWYRFDLVAGNTYTFETSNLASGVDTRLSLFQGTTSTLWAQNDNRSTGDKSSLITFTPATSGPFTLQAGDALNARGSLHTYELTASVVEAGASPPSTTATTSTAANVADWWRANAIVSLLASDNVGGVGVRDITYSASGAVTIASTTTAGDSVTFPVRAEGITTITYFATDYAGNAEAPRTLVIRLDKTRPTVTRPQPSLLNVTMPDATTASVRLRWTGSDAGSGIVVYRLEQSVDGGGYAPVSLAAPTATTTRISLALGHTYRFRVKATDVAGNTSLLATSNSYVLSGYQETDPSISYGGTWNTAAMSKAFGGSVRYSGAANRTATFTFTGGRVAWVTTTSPSRGQAEVRVDGVLMATVDLYSPTSRNRQIGYVQNGLSPAAEHTIEIRVLGTNTSSSTGTRVDIDGFIVMH